MNRQRFKRWAIDHARDRRFFIAPHDLEPLPTGGYRIPWLDSAWSAWLEAERGK